MLVKGIALLLLFGCLVSPTVRSQVGQAIQGSVDAVDETFCAPEVNADPGVFCGVVAAFAS